MTLLDVALAMQVDLVSVFVDRHKYLHDLHEALRDPPAPLRSQWGDRVEDEVPRGKMSRPAPTPRKDRAAK